MITIPDMTAEYATNGSITLSSNRNGNNLTIHINKGTSTFKQLESMLQAHGDSMPSPALPDSIRRNSLDDFDIPNHATHINIGVGEHGDIILDAKRGTFIFGGAGAGKSVLVSNIIGHAMHYDDIALHVMSERHDEYENVGFRSWDDYTSSPAAAFGTLLALRSMVEFRYKMMDGAGKHQWNPEDYNVDPVLLKTHYVIMDGASLFGGDSYGINDEPNAGYSLTGSESITTLILKTARYIAEFGGNAGVYLFVSSQYPERIMHQCDNVIACGHNSIERYRIAFGAFPSYDVPPDPRGRAIIKDASGNQRVFQIPYVNRDILS